MIIGDVYIIIRVASFSYYLSGFFRWKSIVNSYFIEVKRMKK